MRQFGGTAGAPAANDKAASRRLRQVSFAISKNPGAGEGIRTLDPDLGKVVLYH
jgi:hypothetical protein